MKLVVLGGTGFIGRHLLPMLAEAGHSSIVLTRHRERHREVELIRQTRLREADVYDPGQLQRYLEGADAVINLVGILNEPGRGGAGFYRAHVQLVDTMIEACQQAGVERVLHMSALNAGPGSSHYLETKGVGEQHLHRASEQGNLEVTIFQPSVIFGKGDQFFNRFEVLLRIMPVFPLARASARFQPVFAGDVARAFSMALEDPGCYGKTFVLVGPKTYTLKELVAFTARTAGLRRTIISLPDWLARLQAAIMDFIPGKPFSTDNYRSLKVDSISAKNDFAYFKITPQSVESEVFHYLGVGKHQAQLNSLRAG